MRTVKKLLETKSSVLFSVNRATSVYDSLQFMMDKNISALLVIENNQLQGIFTERDYARKIILKGKSSKETSIEDVMTSGIITVLQDETIENCMKIMTENHIRHLPVMKDNQPIGMISIGDLVKFVIEDQKKTIEQLESYINS